MNVSCPDCRSIFRVDPAKVPPAGVRARCSVCGGVIPIPAPTGQNTPVTGTPRAATTTSEPVYQPRPQSAPPAQDTWDPPPFNIPAQRAPAPQAQRPSSPPSAPSPRTEVASAPRARPESVEHSSPAATATPPSPASGLPEFNPPPAIPSFMPPPSSSPFTPPSAPPFVPGGSRPATPTRPPGTPPSSLAATDGGTRRPLNPFLSKDPNQRAKRLARALVSDIITYHPAKHAEGLRDGTLKQLFREEIKKSFEEYIAQVGQQLAESTTYFQEALNEVLGAGKKIF